ncbi:hypothetical protein RFI_08767, partial [Reticulomyxa filosa]
RVNDKTKIRRLEKELARTKAAYEDLKAKQQVFFFSEFFFFLNKSAAEIASLRHQYEIKIRNLESLMITNNSLKDDDKLLKKAIVKKRRRTIDDAGIYFFFFPVFVCLFVCLM